MIMLGHTWSPQGGEPTRKASRRALISALAAGALATGLASCAAEPEARRGSEADPSQFRSPIPASTTADGPAQRPAPIQAKSASAPPTREDILRRFAGNRATQWGLDLPGILTRTESTAVVLTFDACGGPGGSRLDENLIQTLRRLQVPATLFLNARWINANPSASRELAADPMFEIANHGMAHVPLSTIGRSAYGIPGTASLSAALDEVSAGAKAIAALTQSPTAWFRTGTAFYDDLAVQAVAAMDLVPVNFSINSDGGATFAPTTVAAQLAGVGAGDIVIGHMNQPQSGTSAGYATAVPRLIDRGVSFTTLSRAISPFPTLASAPDKQR